jgi:hypothetical protein
MTAGGGASGWARPRCCLCPERLARLVPDGHRRYEPVQAARLRRAAADALDLTRKTPDAMAHECATIPFLRGVPAPRSPGGWFACIGPPRVGLPSAS